MDTLPYWSHAAIPAFEPLQADLMVDTLIIGGGITGVTAAHLLSGAGLRVALVERKTIAARDTGHTTAHLTYMTDTRLSDLASKNSHEAVGIAWQAGQAAMELIRQTVETHGLDCEFAVVPGYLAAYGGNDIGEESKRMMEEARLARNLGFDVSYLESDPVYGLPCLFLPEQMKFHPRKYLAGVLHEAVRNGASIYEATEVTEFGEGYVIANGKRITFGNVVIATHVPLQGESGTFGAALFQTKLALYSTYAVSAEITQGRFEEMIWSDTADPFNYLRIDRHEGRDIAIFGGEDHKTGQRPDTHECFRQLEKKLTSIFPEAIVTHQWTGQVVETSDGLPFIGRTSDRQFIATGFSGNGMTFGTVSAMMARDVILGVANPWSKTFDPSRKILGSVLEYLGENADFPAHLIGDRFRVSDDPATSVSRECGKVIKHASGAVAAFRDEEGKLHLHSAICPHLGCLVAWNQVEKTWDCPCHGSRFSAIGEVIGGPAESSLKPVPLNAGQS